MMRKLLFVGLVCAFTSAGFAQNLVLNGNFSTNDLTDWSVQDDSSGYGPYCNNLPQPGPPGAIYGVIFSTPNSQDEDIYQAINTTAGDSYTYSLYVWPDDQVNYGVSDDLNVYWNTSTFGGIGNVYSSSSLPFNSWTLLSFTVVATGSTTDIGIGGYNVGDNNYVTDISVVPSSAPEPCSMAAFGLGALALIRRRRSRS